MGGHFRNDRLTNTAMLAILILANLAWLLNPHACCPRSTEVESGINNHVEPSCCSMLNNQTPNEPETPENNYIQTYSSINLSLLPDDQFSKGVHSSVSDSIPTSASLLQLLHAPMISEELLIYDSKIPASAIIPRLKKPPCI